MLDEATPEPDESVAIEYAIRQVLEPDQKEIKTDSGLIVVREVPKGGGYL
jgi:hypothetical protein